MLKPEILKFLEQQAAACPSEYREKHKQIPWQKRKDMRKLLVHDEIDLNLVYDTAERDITEKRL